MLTEEERKEHARESHRRWLKRNREHTREYNRKDYQKNREKILERNRKRVLTPEQRERKNEYEKKRKRKLYAENAEYRKAMLEKRRRYKQSKEYAREYWLKNRERLLKKKKQLRHDNPEKNRAHGAVSCAIKNGILFAPDRCSKCNRESKIQAHHYRGYARKYWLDVKWLCKSCHRIEDAKDGYSNCKRVVS